MLESEMLWKTALGLAPLSTRFHWTSGLLFALILFSAGCAGVLINEDTGSNGEYFAEAIKQKKLATLIGMRTWGGAVGIEAHQRMMDGGTVTPPQFAPYGMNGEWLIEGHGVEPDVQIQNMPQEVLQGRDTQLDSAVDLLLQRISEEPMTLPGPPAYPDKSK